MGERGSRLKLFYYLSVDGRVLANVDRTEVEIFLKIRKLKCSRCGVDINSENLGYLGVYKRRALAYCSSCIEEKYREILAALDILSREYFLLSDSRAAAPDR